MVCELHFEIKTAILVITINTAVQCACSLWNNFQIAAWYEHGQHCSVATQRLRLCAVISLAQKAKQNL